MCWPFQIPYYTGKAGQQLRASEDEDLWQVYYALGLGRRQQLHGDSSS